MKHGLNHRYTSKDKKPKQKSALNCIHIKCASSTKGTTDAENVSSPSTSETEASDTASLSETEETTNVSSLRARCRTNAFVPKPQSRKTVPLPPIEEQKEIAFPAYGKCKEQRMNGKYKEQRIIHSPDEPTEKRPLLQSSKQVSSPYRAEIQCNTISISPGASSLGDVTANKRTQHPPPIRSRLSPLPARSRGINTHIHGFDPTVLNRRNRLLFLLRTYHTGIDSRGVISGMNTVHREVMDMHHEQLLDVMDPRQMTYALLGLGAIGDFHCLQLDLMYPEGERAVSRLLLAFLRRQGTAGFIALVSALKRCCVDKMAVALMKSEEHVTGLFLKQLGFPRSHCTGECDKETESSGFPQKFTLRERMNKLEEKIVSLENRQHSISGKQTVHERTKGQCISARCPRLKFCTEDENAGVGTKHCREKRRTESLRPHREEKTEQLGSRFNCMENLAKNGRILDDVVTVGTGNTTLENNGADASDRCVQNRQLKVQTLGHVLPDENHEQHDDACTKDPTQSVTYTTIPRLASRIKDIENRVRFLENILGTTTSERETEPFWLVMPVTNRDCAVEDIFIRSLEERLDLIEIMITFREQNSVAKIATTESEEIAANKSDSDGNLPEEITDAEACRAHSRNLQSDGPKTPEIKYMGNDRAKADGNHGDEGPSVTHNRAIKGRAQFQQTQFPVIHTVEQTPESILDATWVFLDSPKPITRKNEARGLSKENLQRTIQEETPSFGPEQPQLNTEQKKAPKKRSESPLGKKTVTPQNVTGELSRKCGSRDIVNSADRTGNETKNRPFEESSRPSKKKRNSRQRRVSSGCCVRLRPDFSDEFCGSCSDTGLQTSSEEGNAFSENVQRPVRKSSQAVSPSDFRRTLKERVEFLENFTKPNNTDSNSEEEVLKARIDSLEKRVYPCNINTTNQQPPKSLWNRVVSLESLLGVEDKAVSKETTDSVSERNLEEKVDNLEKLVDDLEENVDWLERQMLSSKDTSQDTSLDSISGSREESLFEDNCTQPSGTRNAADQAMLETRQRFSLDRPDGKRKPLLDRLQSLETTARATKKKMFTN